MKVKVGDVVKVKTGELLRFEVIEYGLPGGEFQAQVGSLAGKWLDLRMTGGVDQLESYLENEAERILEKGEYHE